MGLEMIALRDTELFTFYLVAKGICLGVELNEKACKH